MAGMLFRLAFISLLPQGMCPCYWFPFVARCRLAMFTVDAILLEKDRLPVFQSLDQCLLN